MGRKKDASPAGGLEGKKLVAKHTATHSFHQKLRQQTNLVCKRFAWKRRTTNWNRCWQTIVTNKVIIKMGESWKGKFPEKCFFQSKSYFDHHWRGWGKRRLAGTFSRPFSFAYFLSHHFTNFFTRKILLGFPKRKRELFHFFQKKGVTMARGNLFFN